MDYESDSKTMNIGNVKPDGNGNFVGSIRTVGISMQIGLRPLTFDTIKAGKSYPTFGIMARASSDQRYAEVGALWEASSNTSGEIFYQGQIDDPSMAKPLSILLFPQADGSMNVAWTRPRDRSAFGNNGAPQTAGDGLGESTSGETQLPFEPEAKTTGKGKATKGDAFGDAGGALVTDDVPY